MESCFWRYDKAFNDMRKYPTAAGRKAQNTKLCVGVCYEEVRSADAPFPVNIDIQQNRSFIEIWNFMDEKSMHWVQMRPDVACPVSQA